MGSLDAGSIGCCKRGFLNDFYAVSAELSDQSQPVYIFLRLVAQSAVRTKIVQANSQVSAGEVPEIAGPVGGENCGVLGQLASQNWNGYFVSHSPAAARAIKTSTEHSRDTHVFYIMNDSQSVGQVVCIVVSVDGEEIDEYTAYTPAPPPGLGGFQNAMPGPSQIEVDNFTSTAAPTRYWGVGQFGGNRYVMGCTYRDDQVAGQEDVGWNVTRWTLGTGDLFTTSSIFNGIHEPFRVVIAPALRAAPWAIAYRGQTGEIVTGLWLNSNDQNGAILEASEEVNVLESGRSIPPDIIFYDRRIRSPDPDLDLVIERQRIFDGFDWHDVGQLFGDAPNYLYMDNFGDYVYGNGLFARKVRRSGGTLGSLWLIDYRSQTVPYHQQTHTSASQITGSDGWYHLRGYRFPLSAETPLQTEGVVGAWQFDGPEESGANFAVGNPQHWSVSIDGSIIIPHREYIEWPNVDDLEEIVNRWPANGNGFSEADSVNNRAGPAHPTTVGALEVFTNSQGPWDCVDVHESECLPENKFY